MKRAGLLSLMLVALSASAQANLSVDWEWKKEHLCNNTSPALSIAGIPEGTKSLTVQMNDLDFRNKDHGGGTIAHVGGTAASIPEGGLKGDYLGPCPNNFNGFGHVYQITVRALGADGAELAAAVKSKDFSAKTAK
jgi:phosphatidylethanolamine-binding protein (PEBP) family uncharacterized protein